MRAAGGAGREDAWRRARAGVRAAGAGGRRTVIGVLMIAYVLRKVGSPAVRIHTIKCSSSTQKPEPGKHHPADLPSELAAVHAASCSAVHSSTVVSAHVFLR